MYEKYKNIVEEIKFIMPLVLFLPPLLGGIWQLIELYKIDPAYIRFFSATQLLPDGLLMFIILLSLAPTIVMLIIINKIIPYNLLIENKKVKFKVKPNLKHRYILKDNSKKVKDLNKCIDYNKTNYIIILIFLLLFEWITIDLIYSDIKEGSIHLFVFLVEVFFSSFLLAIITVLLYEARKCCKLKFIRGIINKKISLVLFVAVYFMFALIFDLIFIYIIPIIIIASIHKVYLFPHNLININNISSNIKSSYSQKKLLYLNDKYLFLELSDNNESKRKSIKVLKFDSLF